MTDEPTLGSLPSADEQPRATFGRRLAIAFASVAALTVVLVAVLISAVWNYQFDQYLKGNLQRSATGVATLAAQAYPRYGGWSVLTLSAIPPRTVMNVAVQIVDADGRLVYDGASTYQHEQAEGDGGEVVLLAPVGPVVTAPVLVEGAKVGTVHVWAYGAGAVLSDRDAKFRTGSLTALTLAGLVAIAVASLSGLLYSKRLVRPITEITEKVQAMRSGDRDARTGFVGDDEISALGQTFDEMADAIEAEIGRAHV